MDITDETAVSQYIAGDMQAFGILYDRYIKHIYRFVYYKTFVKENAEDLTSDIFHKALKNIHSFKKEKGSFSTWLYQIARNSVIDYYRTRKENVPFDDVFDVGVPNRTAEEHDALYALSKVTTYLETLTARQREIIVLRIWEERSYAEIADILGGTEASVKMAFSRSIRDVREKCGPFALTILVGVLAHNTLPFHTFS